MNKKKSEGFLFLKWFIPWFVPVLITLIVSVGLDNISIDISFKTKLIFFSFMLFWFLIVTFINITKYIVSYRDSKQVDIFPFVYWNVDFDKKGKIFSKINNFNWLIYLDPPKNLKSHEFEQKKLKIVGVFGPYCPEDECECEMNMMKTYFGRYKYTCPMCNSTKKDKQNTDTLKSNVEKIVRLKLDKEKFLN